MSSLKQFILSKHTIAEIIADFRAMFPPYAINPSDAVITNYIYTSFCDIPGGIVNCSCGDNDCAYIAFLYGLAHNLTYFNTLGDTSLIPVLPRLSKSKSADGLKISYETYLSSNRTPAFLTNFFSTTPYGVMLLELLEMCGLTSSPGGYVV